MSRILIAGGGPVGLFLANRLMSLGIECLLVEEKEDISQHSRSIGLHPVSLEMLDRLGLASEFVQSGVRVDTGLAFFNRAPLGRLRFASCPPPFPFVLSLPQQRTEQLLEERLRRLDARVVTRGVKLTSMTQ